MNTVPRALVVDGHRLHSRLVQTFLRQLGWRADVLDDGARALDVLRASRHDLVLLDLGPQDRSSERVCRALRDGLGPEGPSIIGYVAHCTPQERARLLAGGFDAIVPKPVSLTDVMKVCVAVVDGDRWRGRQGSRMAPSPRALALPARASPSAG